MSSLHLTGRITDSPNTPDRKPYAHVLELGSALGAAAAGAALVAGVFIGIKPDSNLPVKPAPTDVNTQVVEVQLVEQPTENGS